MEVIIYQSTESKGKEYLKNIQSFLHANGISSNVLSKQTEHAIQTYEDSEWRPLARGGVSEGTVRQRFPFVLTVSEENADKALSLIKHYHQIESKKLNPQVREVIRAFLPSLLISVIATLFSAKVIDKEIDTGRLIGIFLFTLVVSFILISYLVRAKEKKRQ